MTRDERLEALRALSDAATPGPWEADARVGAVAVYSGERRNCIEVGDGQEVYRRTGWTEDGVWHVDPRWVVDANLIVAAVNVVRALLGDANNPPCRCGRPAYFPDSYTANIDSRLCRGCNYSVRLCKCEGAADNPPASAPPEEHHTPDTTCPICIYVREYAAFASAIYHTEDESCG